MANKRRSKFAKSRKCVSLRLTSNAGNLFFICRSLSFHTNHFGSSSATLHFACPIRNESMACVCLGLAAMWIGGTVGLVLGGLLAGAKRRDVDAAYEQLSAAIHQYLEEWSARATHRAASCCCRHRFVGWIKLRWDRLRHHDISHACSEIKFRSPLVVATTDRLTAISRAIRHAMREHRSSLSPLHPRSVAAHDAA